MKIDSNVTRGWSLWQKHVVKLYICSCISKLIRLMLRGIDV
jgi:hypothetical protein